MLIADKQKELNLSIRQIAEKAQISDGTFFNWIRSPKGAPPRKSYTQSINKRLAAAIKVTPEELADAYNSSAFNPIDPAVPDPEPAPPAPHGVQEVPTAFVVDGLKRFLSMLRDSKRPTFTLAELESFATLIPGYTDPE